MVSRTLINWHSKTNQEQVQFQSPGHKLTKVYKHIDFFVSPAPAVFVYWQVILSSFYVMKTRFLKYDPPSASNAAAVAVALKASALNQIIVIV